MHVAVPGGHEAAVPTGIVTPAPPAPALAAGVELLGAYHGSGYQEAPCLVRRGGRTLEISPLLYLVCTEVDGVRDLAQVATAVSDRCGRTATAADIAYLLDHKLAPLGLLAGGPPTPAPAPRLLGLSLRTAVLSPAAVRPWAERLAVLFRPPVVAVVLAAVAALDGWLLATRDLGGALGGVATQPGLVLVLALLTLVGGAFHELGHATACRYGGAEPGAIGVGLYLVWPVFYNDLNDSYRLDRTGRLRADLGGIYFNAVFVLVLGAAYLATGFAPLLVAVALQHVAVLHQLLPFVRLDGYYLVSDLAGVPDLFGRIRPVVTSLLPGRVTPPAVGQLTRRARMLVTGWVVVAVPLLMALVVLVVASLPRMATTAWASVFVHGRSFALAWHQGALWAGTLDVVGILLLLVPPVAIGLTLGHVAWAAVVYPRRRET